MRRLLGVVGITAVLLLISASVAEAAYCGALKSRSCRKPCCERPEPKCCQQCCTVMKTCKEVVYEPHEKIAYKTVFEKVVDKRVIETVKYVPQTAYRYVPTTIEQPPEAPCCEPAESCAPADCCEPEKCEKMVSVKCLQKKPYTVFRPVPTTKTVEVPRVIVKKVPYKVTCYTKKEICVQVPVKVCCPVPCCGKPKCCEGAE